MISWKLFQLRIFMISLLQWFDFIIWFHDLGISLFWLLLEALSLSFLCQLLSRTKYCSTKKGVWFKFLFLKSRAYCCTLQEERWGEHMCVPVWCEWRMRWQKSRSNKVEKVTSPIIPMLHWTLREEMMEGILHTGAEGSMEIAGCLRMKWNKKNSPAIVFPSLYWLPLGLSSEEYFVSLM